MTLKLPRLGNSPPSHTTLQRYWDSAMTAIEGAFNGNTSVTNDVSNLKTGAAMLAGNQTFAGFNTFNNPPDSPLGYMVNEVQVIGERDTGWTAGTGVPDKGTFSAYAGHTWGGSYVQADQQAMDDALVAASARILALEQALTAHGLIGP